MRPRLNALPPAAARFAGGLAAYAGLAWRAATRFPAFRVTGGLAILLGLAGPGLAASFFFFAGSHARAEMLASNVFLWAFAYAFLVLPPVAGRVSRRRTPAFHALTPAGPESAIAGHFAGFLAAFLAVVAVVLILIRPVEWFFFSGQAASSPGPALVQAALGAVLISGVVLFAQAGGVLFTSACGVIWFLLGTQKAALLERFGSSGCSWLVSACLSWLPDFTLLQIDPRTATPGTTAATGMGPRIAYASLLVALNLTLAVLLAPRTRRRSRGPA